MENRKPTEEEKVAELWEAFQQKGEAGIKEVLHQRNVECRQEKVTELEQRKENQRGL